MDEHALASSLKNQRVAAVAIDVFEEEPLPKQSPLWDLPNLLYSPHIAGYTAAYAGMVQDLFVRNLERCVKRERLEGVVNKKRGY